MAADAAHLAGLGAGPSGSARGHRAHRRIRAGQDVVGAILHRRAVGLDTAQMLVEAPHDLGPKLMRWGKHCRSGYA
jgi:hypothetical protein